MKATVTYTEAMIRAKLATDERWVRRALLRLAERQTAQERSTEHTINHNMRGFMPCDAKWFTRFADFVRRYPNRSLSPKQLKICWRPWREQPAICKYAGQLLQIMEEDRLARRNG